MRVVVVGAGIVGASAAFHLADAGADVIVADGSHEGTATRAGAGIICPWPTASTDEEFVALYVAAAEALPRIVERMEARGGGDSSYRRIGAIVLATDEGRADRHLDEVEQRVRRRSSGSEVIGEICRIDGVEVRRRFPPARSDLSGLWIDGGARLDGRAMQAALLRAAGVEPRRGRAELIARDDRVTGVVVGGEPIEADAVVVAGGAWTRELLEPLGITVDVEPQKGQILHLDVESRSERSVTGEWPSLLPLGPHYLVPFEGGRVVVGATRETGSGFDTRITAAGQREVLDAALEWAPGLADATVAETRVGLRPLAASGRPTLGPIDGVEGLVVGTGLGASGLTIGPLAGRMLAQQIVQE